ncbi:MAG TPA: serine/threonine-protein kinase [Gemmatimonadales bacterium]|nr:serine/threonine-protein kinase [Gemmatimonadales bacterium]
MSSTLLARLQAALGDSYRVERELGMSGIARFFHATNPADRREFAVAALPPAVATRLDPERFQAEISRAARVRHAQLVAPLGARVVGDLAYCIYPYRQGESLRERLQREGHLPADAAGRLLAQIADALAPAHEAGLAHGALRPECVVLDGTRVVVTEFGLAHAVAAAGGGTGPGDAIGSAGYAAPEQEAGRSADLRSDVYALGVIGYELLAGFPPFAGPTAAAVVAARLTGTPEPLDALRVDVPPAVTAAVARALSREPNQRFADALEFREAAGGRRPAAADAGPRASWALVTTGVLLVAAAGMFVRARRPPAPDPDLVVVAPFDVLVPDHSLWREGMVDVLSRNLDGAGPLRTVPPTVAIRHWKGRVDVGPATALGRETGAALAVFGRLLDAGPDSVRISAALVDVTRRSVAAEFEFRGSADRIGELADSLTVALLDQVGRTRPIGAVRYTGVTAVPLPALKAFLRGEQHFRHAHWDSAIADYERAVAAAPDFALALRRLSLTFGWQRSGEDSLGQAYAFRAGAANYGFAPRESLLVVAESINAALWEFTREPQWWPLSRRLFATLDEAARRYAGDPEVWYELGEARFHFGYWHGIDAGDALRAFDRAIELDSTFAPAYIHPVELGLMHEGPRAALRYAAAYTAARSGGAKGAGIPLVARLLRPDADRLDLEPLLDTIATDAIHNAWLTLVAWPDSAETATRLLRYLIRARRGEAPVSDDTVANNRLLASMLSFRGHLRDALAVADPGFAPVLVDAALFGVRTPDSALRVSRRWVAASQLVPAGAALPLWEAVGDTAAVQDYARALTPATVPHESLRRYLTARAAASLALARGDTGDAVRRHAALPESLCGGCQSALAQARLTTAQLLSARGRHQEAALRLGPELPGLVRPLAVLTVLARARANEQLGRTGAALADYRFVADVWRAADPELEPYAQEARAAVDRLTAEPR